MKVMKLASDGLVRISISELMSVPIVHLMSGADHVELLSEDACGRATVLCGHTEWVSQTDIVVSIGWDWRVDSIEGLLRWSRIGPPRTNVLLIDDNGFDKTWSQSLEHIGTIVDALPWAESVADVVGLKAA